MCEWSIVQKLSVSWADKETGSFTGSAEKEVRLAGYKSEQLPPNKDPDFVQI